MLNNLLGAFETGGTAGYIAFLGCIPMCTNGHSRYDGSSIVSRSLELQEPVIYVSFNYRLNGMYHSTVLPHQVADTALVGFGFLASKEVKDAGLGNLGLRDRTFANNELQQYIINLFTERLAFKWVQKYISAFGGDPSKVTLCVSYFVTMPFAGDL